ncbi:FecR family protein [Azospirillum doebereinerae]|nr:FecR domain-containing protein [Azospirillum doebereinerae]MCG5239955.1 FecR domain-containing protein [Azospirillum doebereinerae]
MGKQESSDPLEGAMAEPTKASEWIVALAEAPDDCALHARLDAWLAQSPANVIDWEEMTRTIELMGMTVPVHRHVWGDAANRPAPPPPPTPIPFRPRRATGPRAGWRLGVGLPLAALAAGIVMLLFPSLLIRLEADHRTGTAEVQSFQLADGTTVRMAPESAIGVDFTGNRRQIRLLKGEAFFEVAQDPARPFVVAACDLETTDIGTSFGVRIDHSAAEVSVRDGIVQVDGSVDKRPVSERLTAGERVRIAWDGPPLRSQLPPQQVASWQHGQLVVKQRPVAEVVDALRPYYNGLIVLRGETLAAQPLTGVYNLSDPVAALQAVAAAQGATLRRISPWLLVVSGA